MSTTIFEICKAIPRLNEHGKFDIGKTRRGEEVPSVVDGMTPKRPPVREGLHTFTPAELLFLRVPFIEVNSRVTGYQRDTIREHGRRIALALREGKTFPEIHVAVDGNGVMTIPDGQHRAIGAVIADVPMVGIVRRMSKDEQRQLFADQRKARPVDRNVLILAGSGPYERYIQEAVATDKHPWGQIVSANPHSKTRITPYSMLALLTSYVGNTTTNAITRVVEERWDEFHADELAPLVACFGNKQTNPPAFRANALQGIGEAAMWVLRRNDNVQPGDHERWVTHMPKFPWERYMHVRTKTDFSYHLVAHWNKRLYEARKVRL